MKKKKRYTVERCGRVWVISDNLFKEGQYANCYYMKPARPKQIARIMNAEWEEQQRIINKIS